MEGGVDGGGEVSGFGVGVGGGVKPEERYKGKCRYEEGNRTGAVEELWLGLGSDYSSILGTMFNSVFHNLVQKFKEDFYES